MISTHSERKGGAVRRIVGMMLLFAFMGLPVAGQGELSRPDSTDNLDSIQLSKPGMPDRTRTLPGTRPAPGKQPSAVKDTGNNGGTPDADTVTAAYVLPPDSVRVQQKKEKLPDPGKDQLEHSPDKAMMYALILPGLGQAYNKKYFKIPFVYGALGGVSYWIWYNTQNYREASQNYSDDPSDFNERYLRAYRRYLEMSYIALAGAYALQVLDAYVDAHLFYWDVNPDLSVRVAPAIRPVYGQPGIPPGTVAGNFGLRCKLTF